VLLPRTAAPPVPTLPINDGQIPTFGTGSGSPKSSPLVVESVALPSHSIHICDITWGRRPALRRAPSLAELLPHSAAAIVPDKQVDVHPAVGGAKTRKARTRRASHKAGTNAQLAGAQIRTAESIFPVLIGRCKPISMRQAAACRGSQVCFPGDEPRPALSPEAQQLLT